MRAVVQSVDQLAEAARGVAVLCKVRPDARGPLVALLVGTVGADATDLLLLEQAVPDQPVVVAIPQEQEERVPVRGIVRSVGVTRTHPSHVDARDELGDRRDLVLIGRAAGTAFAVLVEEHVELLAIPAALGHTDRGKGRRQHAGRDDAPVTVPHLLSEDLGLLRTVERSDRGERRGVVGVDLGLGRRRRRGGADQETGECVLHGSVPKFLGRKERGASHPSRRGPRAGRPGAPSRPHTPVFGANHRSLQTLAWNASFRSAKRRANR